MKFRKMIAAAVLTAAATGGIALGTAGTASAGGYDGSNFHSYQSCYNYGWAKYGLGGWECRKAYGSFGSIYYRLYKW